MIMLILKTMLVIILLPAILIVAAFLFVCRELGRFVERIYDKDMFWGGKDD